jgi:hypothetical protein
VLSTTLEEKKGIFEMPEMSLFLTLMAVESLKVANV